MGCGFQRPLSSAPVGAQIAPFRRRRRRHRRPTAASPAAALRPSVRATGRQVRDSRTFASCFLGGAAGDTQTLDDSTREFESTDVASSDTPPR
jgi:hypothetical protein